VSFSEIAIESRALAERRSRDRYQQDLSITGWDQAEILKHLWHDGEFEWELIMKYPNGPSQLEIAVWSGGNLIALGIATVFSDRLLLRFVEASPDHGAELKGQRLPIILEVAANYAEKLGKKEIWMKPKTPELLNHCLTKLGFVAASDGQCRLSLEVTT
jgi:hypothetical protein